MLKSFRARFLFCLNYNLKTKIMKFYSKIQEHALLCENFRRFLKFKIKYIFMSTFLFFSTILLF